MRQWPIEGTGIMGKLKRKISIPNGSAMKAKQYEGFVYKAYDLLSGESLYFAAGGEDVNSLELAHLIPEAEETKSATTLTLFALPTARHQSSSIFSVWSALVDTT